MKKGNKEKKKKLPLGRTVSNVMFALAQVWRVSKWYFIFYFGITFVNAPLDFLTDSFLIKLIVDGIEGGTPVSFILTYMIIIGVIYITVSITQNYFWNIKSPKATRRIAANLQKRLFKKAGEVDLACYETPAFYDKYVKAFDETSSRVNKVMQTISNLVWRVVSLLCNSFLLFYIDPWLILFGLFPLTLGFVRRWGNRLYHEHTVEQKPLDREVRYIRRTFYLGDYAKEMRMSGMPAFMLKGLDSTYKKFHALRIKYGIKRGIARYLQNIGIDVVCILGAMLYAAWQTVALGNMSIGDCIVIFNSIGTISWCLSTLVQSFTEFGEHSLFLEDVRYFLDYEPKIKEDPCAIKAVAGELSLEGVCFRYEGAEEDTLKDITLTIKKGERIALVGHNGSGKSTLVKLLLRLYDPTDGKITLDGRDIREYRLSSYRDLYSSVMQDYRIFSLSVKDNVTMRRECDGDRALVTRALGDSGIYDKIMTLDEGIDTTLTREFDSEGANLSGGEGQKVALARVFAADTPFIILDEPSSALDPIAEHKMFENMIRASEGKSVIFISHRLSSAVDADRIYLMEHGRIIEEGTHTALMKGNGTYAEMFRKQAESYVGEEAPV